MKKNIVTLTLIAGLAATLGACSSQPSPDEFTVLKNPPLVVPPDYHLRPPGDESDVKGAYTPQEIAKRALFGADD